jgi:chorismate-pyruvate lyase
VSVEAISGLGELAERYFLLQGQRPAGVEPVEIAKLDPFLRNLLFTDGTVTRALAVQLLEPVSVRPVSQEEVAVPEELAGYLGVSAGDASVRRRVAIGTASATLLWAESHLLPERLPADFFGELKAAPDGIGQSVQQAALENCRELLWFGLDDAPAWVPRTEGTTIRRLYRLVSGHRASILISESFLVEWRSGVYRLAGLEQAAGPEPTAGEEGR